MPKKSSRKTSETPDANRVRMTFYIDRPAKAALEARNRATGIPVAYMIRQAIDQFIGCGFSQAEGVTARTARELRGQ
jgi:hypothetical protein